MDPKAARRGLDGASVCCREGTSIGRAIMNISDLFLSFRGRISRGQYWIATGMVAVLALALQWMLGVPIMSDPSSLRLRTIRLCHRADFHVPDGSNRGEAAARPRPARHVCMVA